MINGQLTVRHIRYLVIEFAVGLAGIATVPIGGGGGRIVRIGGKLPVKITAGLFYNVAQPAYGGRWVLNTGT